MCVILTLSAGATINKNQLFNAVYNNWHGFGLILRDANNRLELIKEFDENGTDPERVWKLLEDNKDLHRCLHVRHSTKGATDESNVQPFEVYNSNSRQVFFMHNGTLSGFGITTYSYGNKQESGKSDTLEFCEKVLAPALLRWSGENGKADYLDPEFVRLVVDKQWTSSSTGLFVSNDLADRRIGTGWTQYKHPDDSSEGEVWTSNTSYFDRIQRGPHFQRLEAIRKADEEAKKAQEKKEVASTLYDDLNDEIPFLGSDRSGSALTVMDGIKLWSNSNCNKSTKILRALGEITNRWDFDSPNDLAKLDAVTYDEWLEFMSEESEYVVAALLEQLSTEYKRLHLQNRMSQHKHARAEKRLMEINIERKSNESKAA